jgi:hypothetical protein
MGADRTWWSGRSSKPRRRRLRRLRWVRFPHAPATLALLGVLLAAAPARVAAQDTTSIAGDTAASRLVRRDSLSGPRAVSPMGSFFRSFLLPGWGQARLNRKLTGGIFLAWEGVTLGMSLKTRHELAYLRRTRSGRAEDKRREHEDWLVLLGFNHLFAGLEAYVSAHLAEFPPDLHLRAVPGGVGASLTVPIRIP